MPTEILQAVHSQHVWLCIRKLCPPEVPLLVRSPTNHRLKTEIVIYRRKNGTQHRQLGCRSISVEGNRICIFPAVNIKKRYHPFAAETLIAADPVFDSQREIKAVIVRKAIVVPFRIVQNGQVHIITEFGNRNCNRSSGTVMKVGRQKSP